MPTFDGEIEIPFVPTERDVVSTKLRNWTLQHQGNLDYADLLNDFADRLPNPAEPSHLNTLREYSDLIVNIITVDRQGRFLKLAEGETRPKVCILMPRRGAVHKVMNGLKNKQISLLKRLGKPIPPISIAMPKEAKPVKPKAVKTLKLLQEKGIAKQQKVVKPKTVKPKAVKTLKLLKEKGLSNRNLMAGATSSGGAAAAPPKMKKRKSSSSKHSSPQTNSSSKPRITKHYQAKCKEGSAVTIDPYALELVSHVCNNNERISSINNPLKSRYDSPEEEPDKERMIRLQLRHRFHSAVAIQMPVVIFARKLVEDVWGGQLIEEEIVRKQAAGGSDDGDMPLDNPTKRNKVGGDEREDEDHTLLGTDRHFDDGRNSPDPYRRDYYHDGSGGNSGNSGSRRKRSQKFEDAFEDEDAMEETYGYRSRRFMEDAFFDARESVQESIPSLHTATSSFPKTSKPKKRKRRAPSTPRAPAPKKPGGMRGNRIACFTWEDRMVQLKEYSDLFGHLKVPTAKKGQYYTLGAWLAAQKSLYKKGTLKEERLADLRRLGCVGFGGPAG